MKINVLQDKCIGCGACVAIAPENFDFNENGLSSVIEEKITEQTIEAKEACPVYAIEIEESNVVEMEENETCECGEDCNCGEGCECQNIEETDEELEEAA